MAGCTEKSQDGTSVCLPATYCTARPNTALSTVTVVLGRSAPVRAPQRAFGDFRPSSSGTGEAQPPMSARPSLRVAGPFSCSSASAAPITG